MALQMSVPVVISPYYKEYNYPVYNLFFGPAV